MTGDNKWGIEGWGAAQGQISTAIEFLCTGKTARDRTMIAEELVALVRSLPEAVIRSLSRHPSMWTSTRGRGGPDLPLITLSMAPCPRASGQADRSHRLIKLRCCAKLHEERCGTFRIQRTKYEPCGNSSISKICGSRIRWTTIYRKADCGRGTEAPRHLPVRGESTPSHPKIVRFVGIDAVGIRVKCLRTAAANYALEFGVIERWGRALHGSAPCNGVGSPLMPRREQLRL